MLGFGSPLHTETLTVSTSSQGGPDADGVPARVEGPSIVLAGCNVQPVSTVQATDGGLHVTTTYRVSAPGVDWQIAAGERVTWRQPGEWFVVGDPQQFTAVLPHTEFTISTERG